MARFRCNVCNVFEYDETRGDSPRGIKPGTKPDDFTDSWRCPICDSNKTHLKPIKEKSKLSTSEHTIKCPVCKAEHKITITHLEKTDMSGYLGEWERESDELEKHMADIHTISNTRSSIIEPMRTTKDVISWDDIFIKGAQIARFPLNKDEPVNTRTVIGPKAKHPLVIETPIYITHMSYGALSRDVKVALAKGSAAVKTAMCSGEGGILTESMDHAYKYIFEYVPNQQKIAGR